MPTPTLPTDRLLLRPWRQDDLAPFAQLNADPKVMEFLGRGPLRRADSDAFAARIIAAWDNSYGLWAVEVVGGPAFIGYVGLADARFEAPFTPAVEVGWRLACHAWGHGYATEAARRSFAFGFQEAGLPEILSFTAAMNTRSRAVMERIGMRLDPAGDFDHPAVPPSSPLRSHVLYRLTEAAEQRYRRQRTAFVPPRSDAPDAAMAPKHFSVPNPSQHGRGHRTR